MNPGARVIRVALAIALAAASARAFQEGPPGFDFVKRIAVGAAAWYSKQGYFAQIEDSHVVIYRGHPGGILGFQPELEYKTTIVVADLTEAQRADLAEPKEFSSRLAVDRYIQRIETDIDARLTPTTTLPPLTPTAPTTTTGP